MQMFRISISIVIILPFLAQPSQGQNVCQSKVSPYLNVRNKDDNGTRVMVNYRQPVDNSAVTQAQMDKVLIGLKPKGDGNAMKGRNKELDAGKLSMANNNEIDRGNPIDTGHFPWHVGINVDGEHFCSGALISGRHVITVAHCLRESNNFTLTLGSIERSIFESNLLVMTTDNKVVHQSYVDDSFAFDVALITLPVPIATNGNNIRPVSLPKRSDVIKTFAKEKAYLTGWGFTQDGTKANTMLTKSSMTIMDLGDCWKIYGDVVTFQTMCTAGKDLNSNILNTCFANDGSPLVYRDSENTWSLLGLLSFRSDVGCNSGHPLGFLRTTSVLAWISDKTSIAVRN